MVNSTRRNFFLGLIGLGGIGAAVATNPLAVLRGADERDRDVYQDIETILDERFISKTTWCRFWEGTGRPTFAEYASLVSDLSDLSSSQRKRRMRDLIDEDFRQIDVRAARDLWCLKVELSRMFLDFRKSATPNRFEFDVCIIGAGPAGISIARELGETGLRVGLLESGGYDADGDTQALYAGETVGFQHTDLDACRLRYLGGSSNCWNGWCAPLEEIDFEERAWVPNSGWPIDLSELEPFYRRAQAVCEVGPYRYGESVWDEIPQIKQPFDDALVRSTFWQYSPPTRFGQRYRAELANLPDVTILLHANAINLAVDDSGKAISEIEISTLEGRGGRVGAKAVVLACGGIENPRLLLASNDTLPNGVANQNDQVGRYFMEHPYAISAYVVSKPFDHQPSVDKAIEGTRLESVFCTGFQAQRDRQVMNSMALFWPDQDIEHLFGWGRGMLPEAPPGYSAYGLMSQSEQAPNPLSRIGLSANKDRFGKPMAKMDWRLLPIDKETVRVQMELLGGEYARLGLGRLKLADWLLDGDAFWGVGGGNHHMGTTRMGDDPLTSVVDRDCRVHGMRNLFVAGSSVFSTAGWANPTLTLVALALRLSDKLKLEI
eukprot:s1_g2601.t1